jgi:hypothetical protein
MKNLSNNSQAVDQNLDHQLEALFKSQSASTEKIAWVMMEMVERLDGGWVPRNVAAVTDHIQTKYRLSKFMIEGYFRVARKLTLVGVFSEKNAAARVVQFFSIDAQQQALGGIPVYQGPGKKAKIEKLHQIEDREVPMIFDERLRKIRSVEEQAAYTALAMRQVGPVSKCAVRFWPNGVYKLIKKASRVDQAYCSDALKRRGVESVPDYALRAQIDRDIEKEFGSEKG